MSDRLVPRSFWNDGGPLIAVPDAAIAHWEGIDPPSHGRVVSATLRWSNPDDSATDYDRACDVGAESARALTVGDSWGIVLGTAVAQDAQWIPTDQPDQFYLVGIETTEDGSPGGLRRLAEEQPPGVLADAVGARTCRSTGSAIGKRRLSARRREGAIGARLRAGGRQ